MSSISRREIMMGLATTAVTIPAAVAVAARLPLRPDLTPDKLASDESYWAQVAAQYDITKEVVQLENGNWGSMSLPVLAAYENHLQRVHRENSFYARREYNADLSDVRSRVARSLGVSTEEIALTRNATEALQALIGGYNLLKPGDSVLFADTDYDAMQTAMQWLSTRRGVNVAKIELPEPSTYQGIIDAYAAALQQHPRTRLMLLTHVSHRAGLLLPVKELIALARRNNVDVILDSAHAWGQTEFSIDDIDADFVGFNAHKWIGAPIGVGVLYIRRSRIRDIDPFMGDVSFPAEDVRARVHSGTSNFAAFLAVREALDFHESIGTPAKEARLRSLRDQWAEPLRDNRDWEVLTPPDRRLYAGITSFRRRDRRDAKQNVELARHLLEEAKIFTVYRDGLASGACVRVTPSMFTRRDDVNRLLKVLEGPALRW